MNEKSKLSVVQSCKNRNANLINSIKSYINNDKIDDIVIVDFNSTDNVKLLLDKEFNSSKITVIEVATKVPYMASWSNNIGLYFAKNNTILKLDADNIILDQTFINELDCDNMDNTLMHVDWRDGKNENEYHLNGVFILTKNDLKKYGYHDQKYVFYGWEDEEIKVRFKGEGVEIIKLNPSYFLHQEQTDSERVSNQSIDYWSDFYGFDIKNISDLYTLSLYNKTLDNSVDRVIYEEDIIKIFNIIETKPNYIKIEINNIIERFECSNYNSLNKTKLSCCREGIFKKIVKTLFYKFENTKLIRYNELIKKYNIIDEKNMMILFYLMQCNYNIDKVNNIITINDTSNLDTSINILHNVLNELKKSQIILNYINDKSLIYDVLFFLEFNITISGMDISPL